MRQKDGDCLKFERTSRAILLASTALLVAGVALADPAPTTLPKLSGVIAGRVAVQQTGAANLQVTQSSASAVVNWRSFSVGSQAKVVFTDPTPHAITINRVVGPDPSVIAGQVRSNGRLVLVNQSGITVAGGAKIDAQSLVLSAPGITEANARAGKLIFDQPARAGAGVSNAGTLTVAQTGLAALVAPSVANSGVIRAPLGTVVLAGAEAHTVDFYGDGLLSIDVTRKVTTIPVGSDGKFVTRLVSNSGTIVARGGSVLLTAAAVEGLVSDLVNADGRITTSSGSGGGRIAITAAAGNIVVPASARISANATRNGNGGTVRIVASNGRTSQAGRVAARGAGRGRGGSVEVSGDQLVLGGAIDVSAPSGQAGSILLDPVDIVVTTVASTCVVAGCPTVLVPSALQAMSGNVTIAATGNVTIASPLDFTVPGSAQSVSLTAGGGIAVNAAITLVDNFYRLSMRAATGAITLAATINPGASGTLDLSAGGGISQSFGSIIAGSLLSSGGVTGAVTLLQPGNQIGTLGNFSTSGGFRLSDITGLSQTGTLTAHDALLSVVQGLTIGGSIIVADTLALAQGGAFFLTGSAALQPGIVLAANATIQASRLGLYAIDRNRITAISEDPTARIIGNNAGGAVVTGNIYSGNVKLTGANNAIAALDGFSLFAGGALALRSGTLLTISAPLLAPNVAIVTQPASGTAVVPGIAIGSDIIVPGVLSLISNGSIVRSGGVLTVGALTGSAIHLADFGLASSIGVLGDFAVSGSVLLVDNAIPLTIQGTVRTEFFTIAATGSLVLAGNIVTLGVSRSQSTGGVADGAGSTLSVLADAQGNAGFAQIGVSSILPLNGTIATVRIQLPSVGGSITLNNLSAPSADLVVFNPVGTISGNANVGGLLVVGRSGGTDLSGSIGTATTPTATTTTTSLSEPDDSYRMNACTVRSVTCRYGPVTEAPPTSGLVGGVLQPIGVKPGEIRVPLPGNAGLQSGPGGS